MTPYHNHRGDRQAAEQHQADCAWTAGVLLAGLIVLVFGCWLGYRVGWVACLVSQHSP